MKSIYSLLFLLAMASISTYAQGNLQFNRAIFYEFNATSLLPNNQVYDSVLVTVPANKTWKIESAGIGFTSNQPGVNSGSIYINNKLIFSNYSTYLSPYPIWLPSGSYTFKGFSTLNLGSAFFVSGIEFNITP